MSVQVAALVLAALGKFTLWGAVLVDVGTALAVIANSLRLLRHRVRPDQAPRGGPDYICARTQATAAVVAAAAGSAGRHGKCCAGAGCSSGGVGESSGGTSHRCSSGSSKGNSKDVLGEECGSGRAGPGGALHPIGDGCSRGTSSSKGTHPANTPVTDGSAQKLHGANSASTSCSADDVGCASLSRASSQASGSHSAPQTVAARSCCSSDRCTEKAGPAEHAAVASRQAPNAQACSKACCDGREMTTCSRKARSKSSTDAATPSAAATEDEHAGATVAA